MDFPVTNLIKSEEIEKRDYYDHLFKEPGFHVLDASRLSGKKFDDFIHYLDNHRYLCFPYGILIQVGDKQREILDFKPRPPLTFIVNSEDERKQFLQNFYENRSKSKGKSPLLELLLGQTWPQLKDPENIFWLKERASWKAQCHQLEEENDIYEFICKHLEQ